VSESFKAKLNFVEKCLEHLAEHAPVGEIMIRYKDSINSGRLEKNCGLFRAFLLQVERHIYRLGIDNSTHKFR
jgi:hypothetical protein